MRSILHNLYMLREKSRKDIYQNIDNSSFLVIRTQYSNFYFLNIFLIFHYNPVFILLRGRIVHACFLKVWAELQSPGRWVCAQAWLLLALVYRVGLSVQQGLETLASVVSSHPTPHIQGCGSRGLREEQPKSRDAASIKEIL